MGFTWDLYRDIWFRIEGSSLCKEKKGLNRDDVGAT